MAKILPWTRAIVLILSMLIAQFPLLDASAAPAPVDVAAPLGGSAPDAGEGELRLAASRPIGVPNGPARQDWDNECAIKVLAAAVTDPPAEPDHESPPSGTTNTEPFGATAIEDA